MIIDEINRAELSKVFGELFFSIDPGYRGEKSRVELQYSNLYKKNDDDEYYEPFKDGFYVPENVYIIATMNDIDRSIEPFDFAMKRRFAWHEISFKDTYLSMFKEKQWGKEAEQKMFALNAIIKEEFSEAYKIGGAYFLKLDELDGSFDDLWKYHINPLLKDYLKGHNNTLYILDKFLSAFNSGKTADDTESIDDDNT